MSNATPVRRRLLLGAFGDPGHAFPMIALGRALAARGHDVTLQTWKRWREHVEAEGLGFAPAPEYEVFPSGGAGSPSLDFYEAVVHASADTVPLVRELRPDVVVADILTLAPALAAEIEGVPWATLIPHVHPHGEPDFPIYSLGARLARTAAGRSMWRLAQRPVHRGLERGRRELNETRERLGLAPHAHVHGGISRQLALVATFPQLEYPRRGGGSGSNRWGPDTHVVGPRVKAMVRAFREGDAETARQIDQELEPVYELLKVQTNPIAIKAALNLLGHDVGGLRLPLVEADEGEVARIRGCLERVGVLTPVAV